MRMMSVAAAQIGAPIGAIPASLEQPERWSDQAVLQTLGIALTIAGLLFLAAAGQVMSDALPPTLNIAIGTMVGIALGVALTITGLVYLFAVREHVESRIGPEGLCVSCNPETGLPEWLKPENIEHAAIRPWLFSPWFKTKRYYELDLKVRDGALVVDETFLVHVYPGFHEFVKKLRGALADRLQVQENWWATNA
jgi:hypothetical protein